MSEPASLRLYGHQRSGNCYTAALMLALTETEHEFIRVDLPAGEQRRPEYLAINRFGQLPTLVHGGQAIAQSPVIVRYLARLTGRFAAADARAEPRVEEWLVFQQDQLFPGVGRSRFFTRIAPAAPPVVELFRGIGLRALATLETALGAVPYLAGAEPTIADIANYAYASLAEEAGFDMAEWPRLVAWRRAIEALPGWNTREALMPEPAESAP